MRIIQFQIEQVCVISQLLYINHCLDLKDSSEKRNYLIYALVDLMLNYNTTSLDLEEYLLNFMLDEFIVICDEGDDISYKEIVDTVITLYEQSKRGSTEQLEKLREIDHNMKEHRKRRMENELDAQRKFEEHMKQIQPDQEVSDEDDMDEEEKNQLEDDGFTVVAKKKNKKKK